ncbi:MAG TPA: NUDIX hydrolase [Desulfobacterales bacterium]|nr:NUDIX hydrolase [Desulfobacterales bacterium]
MKIGKTMRQFFKESPRQNKSSRFKYCPQCGSSLATNHRKAENKIKCNNCDFIQYSNPLPCVSVIIKDDDGRVLIGRRITGKKLWCLPCGFVEAGENFLNAGHREVKEETGLEVQFEQIVNVVSNEFSSFESIVIVLEAKIIGGSPTAGDDITELKWIQSQDCFEEFEFTADKHITEKHFSGHLSGILIDRRYETKGI